MKAVLAAVMGAQSAFAYSPKADYLQGYIHGAMDGKDSCTHIDGCHWYVLEPGKGFEFQSKRFVEGYVKGFCSSSPGTSSDADEATFSCPEGPSSASWVSDH